MSEIASQTLELVGRELNHTLAEARTAIESYVEQPDNVSLLERCKQELHRTQGVLRVLEIYGAALLAEEMEQVADYLIATVTERKGQAESLDALLRSLVQLPGYLERVLSGGRDLALVLLPLLNDLRAVRGSALLSEGTLLLLNLKSDRQAQPLVSASGEPQLTVEQWCRRLRSQFQAGLIGWIRGERIEHNLAALAQVADKLEHSATRQPVFQLWWVAGALIEALREGGLEGGVSVKRLLGLADREIRRLYELGEARYCQSPPVELLNNLLYYVGRAQSAGPRVSAVRTSFRLSELLPVDESIERERESLSAPSVKLMQTVAVAIREDLGKVKEALEQFARRGARDGEELRPQVLMLRKIGDTLGVLGLGEQRATVQTQTERLERILSGAEAAGEPVLVEIAASLIAVEDRLDDSLVGMIRPTGGAPADGTHEDHEFREVQAAVLRECIQNVAWIKEAVTQSLGGSLDAAALDSWQGLVRGLKAALLMLGKTRAVEILEGIATQLRRIMRPGAPQLPPGWLDRLADAIVSIEYYMETLQAGRSDPWYMLDNAQSCLQALERAPAEAAPLAPIEPAAFARTVLMNPAEMHATATIPDLAKTGLTKPSAVGLSATAKMSALAENASPELLRLFVEEAQEELEKIQRQFPLWDQNPLDRDALEVVRRSFHTLKGSGRMVGARELGELAWATESLLNRLLDNTLTRTQAIVETLRQAIATLPRLIERLRSGQLSGSDSTAIVAAAHALAAGREAGAPQAAPAEQTQQTQAAGTLETPVGHGPDMTPEEPPAPPAPPPPHTGIDEALREIYARETEAHVATVREFLKREAQAAEPHPLPEEVYRACHTLAGSSKTAQARNGVRLAEPLDHWIRRTFASGVGLRTADLTLLADCMAAMESVAEHLEEPTGYFASHRLLIERLIEAEKALDERIALAARETASPVEVAPLPVPAAAASPLEPPEATADFDPEVAAVFTEEALELIDASERALAEWRAAPASGERPFALKRALHTLKGGARMAGIMNMGDLAHELETLVAQAESGALAAGDVVFDVVQASLDELARMRETVANGQGVPPARSMIARIRQLTHPGQQAALEAAPAVGQAAPAVGQAAPAVGQAEPAVGQAEPAVGQAAPAVEQAAPAVGQAEPADQAGSQAYEEALPAAGAATGPIVTAAASTPGPQPEPRASELPALEPEAGEVPVLVPAEPAAEILQAAQGSPPAAPAAEPERPIVPEDFPVLQPALPEDMAPMAFEPPAASSAERPPMDSSTPPSAPISPLAFPQPVPPGREPVAPAERVEMARVDAELLDKLLNVAGEASIARSRLEQQVSSIEFNLGELSRTVTRLKEQLRSLEIETEAQILNRHDQESGHRSDFDPLELDRYSSIQQFSRALAESANDVASLQQLLENLSKDAQTLLQQQARTMTELQNGLMRTRMVPFQQHIQRLARIVRQAAADTGKRAELVVEGAAGELDRQVLERMLPPFEHMLRNAVVHGIEIPEERQRLGKPPVGRIELTLRREGAQVVVCLKDDGAGMNLDAICAKGRALGLIPPGPISDEEAMQLILEPGFSTAGSVTQQAGRGVGMDVVATEIKRLGGALHMQTRQGEGTEFTIRLPFTLAISHALIVRTADELYALPLPTVEGVLRLPATQVEGYLGPDAATYEYGGQRYRFQHLALFVGLTPSPLPGADATVPVVLVRAGEHSTALVADELVGNREIVVKSVGPQISSIRGVSGATILGDGRIVIILDIGALVRAEWRGRGVLPVSREKDDRRTFALVVDDSITVRRVTQRLLERNGMRVLTARDGMDAVALLQDHVPDIILLDIEMPRMDGYEVAAHVRNDARLKDVPIIMITSRVGEKHRARAIEFGVDDYLGKPYQETELLEAIAPLVERTRAAREARVEAAAAQGECT
jgi:chemosensory pili system protein ChpA (sensor histidine kinase/response regulator)